MTIFLGNDFRPEDMGLIHERLVGPGGPRVFMSAGRARLFSARLKGLWRRTFVVKIDVPIGNLEAIPVYTGNRRSSRHTNRTV